MAKYYSVDNYGVYYVSSTRNNTPETVKLKHPEVIRECECGRNIYSFDGTKMMKISYNWKLDRVEIKESKNSWAKYLITEITKRKTKNFYPTKKEYRQYLSKQKRDK